MPDDAPVDREAMIRAHQARVAAGMKERKAGKVAPAPAQRVAPKACPKTSPARTWKGMRLPPLRLRRLEAVRRLAELLVSDKEIARRLRISESAVRGYLKELRKAGELPAEVVS